jgi:hypothetical protein
MSSISLVNQMEDGKQEMLRLDNGLDTELLNQEHSIKLLFNQEQTELILSLLISNILLMVQIIKDLDKHLMLVLQQMDLLLLILRPFMPFKLELLSLTLLFGQVADSNSLLQNLTNLSILLPFLLAKLVLTSPVTSKIVSISKPTPTS